MIVFPLALAAGCGAFETPLSVEVSKAGVGSSMELFLFGRVASSQQQIEGKELVSYYC